MSSYWFHNYPDGIINNEMRSVVVSKEGLNALVDEAFDFPNLMELFFGSETSFLGSIIYFPMYIASPIYTFRIRATKYDNIPATEIPTSIELSGYTLGEYYCEPIHNSFLDYDPYSSLQVYLPYYGFADIKLLEVMGKYIQFRLRVDFKTGQAVYYIGVNDHSVSHSSAIWNVNLDRDTRIIATYVFQLGVLIPIGKTNVVDSTRNIINSAIKTAAIIGASYVAPALGAGIYTSEVVNTTTTSPTTTATKARGTKGRLVTQSAVTTQGGQTTESSVRTTDARSQFVGTRINACFEGVADAISYANFRVSTDKANNMFADGMGCTSIVVIRRHLKTIPRDESFGKLYGFPVGEVRKLNTLSGYTEISNIHIEGEGFETATHTEIAMLNKLLSDGVIL